MPDADLFLCDRPAIRNQGSRLCGRRGRGGCRGCSEGLGGRRENESLANEGEALLGEFGLEKLIFRAGKQVGRRAGDGGDEVVDCYWFGVESALLVGIGGELNGRDGSGLFGDDCPEVAVVGSGGDGEQRLQGSGIEVRKKDGRLVGIEPGGVGAAVGRDVQEELLSVGLGDNIDSGIVDDGAELNVEQRVGRREFFGFGEGVGEALHLHADQGRRVDAGRFWCVREARGADGLAILADVKIRGLREGRGRSAEKNEGKKSRGRDQGANERRHLTEKLDTKRGERLRRGAS